MCCSVYTHMKHMHTACVHMFVHTHVHIVIRLVKYRCIKTCLTFMVQEESCMSHHCDTLHRKTAPHCTTLHHAATHRTMLHHVAQHCPTLHHAAPRYTTLHHAAPYSTTLCHTATHHTTQHYAAPHRTTLHHTAPHCTTLQHTFQGGGPRGAACPITTARCIILRSSSIFSSSSAHTPPLSRAYARDIASTVPVCVCVYVWMCVCVCMCMCV